MACPLYPVYVPSKGRAAITPGMSTIERLVESEVPVRVVVEEADAAAYRKRWPSAEVLVLPFSDLGSVVPARNWIKQHAIDEGHARHWQLDDNIQQFLRLYKGRRIPVNAGIALRVCETFTDRYENIAIAGLNYEMFVVPGQRRPFYVNTHVYSCCLFDNSLPLWWRGRYNEDTDLCLQALAGGWCTVTLNCFLARKLTTMKLKGGNTDTLDYHGDGRLHMARALERQWPHVVTTERRFGRPQHVVRDQWKGFDTPLRRRADIDWDALPAVDELGMQLTQVAPIRSAAVQEVLDDWR